MVYEEEDDDWTTTGTTKIRFNNIGDKQGWERKQARKERARKEKRNRL